MSDTQEPQRFSAGDTISIGMEFQVNSGVEEVYALFFNAEDHKHTIGLHGNGGGSTRPKMSMEAQVATDLAPGEYRCRYVHVRDVYGNYAVSYPDRKICFWVDGTGDAYEPRYLASQASLTPDITASITTTATKNVVDFPT